MNILTNQIVVEEMPIFEFDDDKTPASLKNISGDSRRVTNINGKDYVKAWNHSEDEWKDMKKGNMIRVKDLKEILAAGAVE